MGLPIKKEPPSQVPFKKNEVIKMQNIIHYGTPGGNYGSPSSYSGSPNISPILKVKTLEGESLQEKVRILGQQITERRVLLERFETESQSRINQLSLERTTQHYFKQETSWIEREISKIRLGVQEEKAKVWKDIRELEMELAEAEFQANKRKIKNSMFYQTPETVYRGAY